jgi:hypothetical protein
MRHHPTRHVPGHAAGVTELADNDRADGSLHGPALLAAATLGPWAVVVGVGPLQEAHSH